MDLQNFLGEIVRATWITLTTLDLNFEVQLENQTEPLSPSSVPGRPGKALNSLDADNTDL